MEQAILKALTYFDLFEYPLTAVEAWKYAPVRECLSLMDVVCALRKLEINGLVEHHCGFWTLPGRASILVTRTERYIIAERKYGRVKQALHFLARIPSIRMVAVANTLAWNHARDASDIDFFIVTRPGALWKSRLLGVLPFALLGLRPRQAALRDTFCFSFFAAESALDFSSLAVTGDDPYLRYWLATLVPVHDPDGLMEGLWDANQWLRDELANAWQTRPVIRRRAPVAGSKISDIPTTRSMKWDEGLARAFQLLWLPPAVRSIMNVDGRVVVTDEVLKFHVNDRRQEIAARYRERCRGLGLYGLLPIVILNLII